MKAVSNFMTMVASAIGKFVMTVVQAARNSFKLCLETIIPFLIFVSTVFTLIRSGKYHCKCFIWPCNISFWTGGHGTDYYLPASLSDHRTGSGYPAGNRGSHRRADQYRCSSADDGTAHSVYHSSALRRRLYSGRNVFV